MRDCRPSRTLGLLLLASFGAAACGGESAPAGLLVIEAHGLLPIGDAELRALERRVASDDAVPAQAKEAQDDATLPAEATVEGPAPADLPEEPVPAYAGPITAALERTGGELASGLLRAVIPSLREPTEVTLRRLDPGELSEPRPLSVVVAAAELSPRNTITNAMMQLTLPLERPLEPGTRLQLLAFSRSTDAFSVVDENHVSEDGTVTFRTDLMTEYAVIAVPERRETTCLGGPFRLNERAPGPDELEVVGRVEREDRLSPEIAAAVLTDMRYLPHAEAIVFKNEERLLGTEGTPGPHEAEDFLVDPRLAGPLIALGLGVLEQWVDPIGGGPALQLRVTDAYDGQIEHSVYSNHYRGLAIDMTLSPVPAASRDVREQYYGWLARQAVCAGFDFVDFENRFHIHASSRGARLAWIEEGPEGRALVLSRVDGTQRQTLHEELGIELEGRDFRWLRFVEDGRSLELFGHDKGLAEAWRIDLDTLSAAALPYPEPGPERQQEATIDSSLFFRNETERVVLARPGAPGEEAARTWREATAPFPLTGVAVRAIVSAAWTTSPDTLAVGTVGELQHERE